MGGGGAEKTISYKILQYTVYHNCRLARIIIPQLSTSKLVSLHNFITHAKSEFSNEKGRNLFGWVWFGSSFNYCFMAKKVNGKNLHVLQEALNARVFKYKRPSASLFSLIKQKQSWVLFISLDTFLTCYYSVILKVFMK